MLPLLDLPPEIPSPAPVLVSVVSEKSWFSKPPEMILAQATQSKQEGIGRALSICKAIENKEESRLSAVNAITPVGAAMTYLERFEHHKFNEAAYVSAYNNSRMTLLQAPEHGTLELFDKQKAASYDSTDYSYEGADQATVLVEVGGYQVKVIYHFVLMHDVPGSGAEGDAEDQKDICPKGRLWRISTSPNAEGKLTLG